MDLKESSLNNLNTEKLSYHQMKANLVVINDVEEDIIENSEDYKIKETILL